MPELPEVETVRRGLAPVMEGALITSLELRRDGLRFPFPRGMAECVSGATITSVSRRAKYVLVNLSTNDVLIMHLGMSGSFRIDVECETHWPGVFHHDRSKNIVHDHVVFHLQTPNGKARVIYNDPRRFGYMNLIPSEEMMDHPLFANLGVEPLGNEMHGATLAERFSGKNTPLKSALLDQRIIAGLGNIYVCEALWISGLSPKRKARTLVLANGAPSERLERLATAVRDVIARAIEAGGSSLRDHRQADGSLGYFQHSFRAYGREDEPCLNNECTGTIKRIVQSGRSTFFCPTCQR